MVLKWGRCSDGSAAILPGRLSKTPGIERTTILLMVLAIADVEEGGLGRPLGRKPAQLGKDHWLLSRSSKCRLLAPG